MIDRNWYESIRDFTPKSTYFKVDNNTTKVLIASMFDKDCL